MIWFNENCLRMNGFFHFRFYLNKCLCARSERKKNRSHMRGICECKRNTPTLAKKAKKMRKKCQIRANELKIKMGRNHDINWSAKFPKGKFVCLCEISHVFQNITWSFWKPKARKVKQVKAKEKNKLISSQNENYIIRNACRLLIDSSLISCALRKSKRSPIFFSLTSYFWIGRYPHRMMGIVALGIRHRCRRHRRRVRRRNRIHIVSHRSWHANVWEWERESAPQKITQQSGQK